MFKFLVTMYDSDSEEQSDFYDVVSAKNETEAHMIAKSRNFSSVVVTKIQLIEEQEYQTLVKFGIVE